MSLTTVRPLPWSLRHTTLPGCLSTTVFSFCQELSSNADVMSQHAALTSLFGDDPFFSQEKLLWPLRGEALTSLKQDFFSHRAKLVDGLLKELHDGPHLLKLPKLPLMSSTLAGYVIQWRHLSGDLIVLLELNQ